MKFLELKIPPGLLTGIFAFIMFNVCGYLPEVDIGVGIPVILALIIFCVACYFFIFGMIEFRKHKTTVDPRSPQKVSALVDTGVYAVSRNPMYLGFALFLFSIVIFLRSPVLIVGVILFIVYVNRFHIVPEEQALLQLFGDRYEEYSQKVRRWI